MFISLWEDFLESFAPLRVKKNGIRTQELFDIYVERQRKHCPSIGIYALATCYIQN